MPFHTAIHKVPGYRPSSIGLTDIGRIEEGAIADIAVLDPAAIIDKATFDNPHQYAKARITFSYREKRFC